jgi:hypothetical protein
MTEKTGKYLTTIWKDRLSFDIFATPDGACRFHQPNGNILFTLSSNQLEELVGMVDEYWWEVNGDAED